MDYKSGRAVVLALLILAGALALVARFGQPRFVLEPRSPSRPPVIALLAFENLSGDPELELLASELTEAVSKSLTGSGVELRVHHSAWVHTGSERGIETIAQELGADYVVAGSVDEANGRIDVDAYLFRGGKDRGLWAERMSWGQSEGGTIAPDVARRIGDALGY